MNSSLKTSASTVKYKTPKTDFLHTARKSRAAWVLTVRDKIRVKSNETVAQVPSSPLFHFTFVLNHILQSFHALLLYPLYTGIGL